MSTVNEVGAISPVSRTGTATEPNVSPAPSLSMTLRALEKAYRDSQNCGSADTREGRAEIQRLADQIAAIKSRIANPPPPPAPRPAAPAAQAVAVETQPAARPAGSTYPTTLGAAVDLLA